MTRRGITTLIWGLAFAVPGTWFAGVAPDPTTPSLSDRVEVRRIVWPVYIGEASPAGSDPLCDHLGPTDVVIEEQGKAVTVTQLERRPLPVIHALLLDTSNSMRKRGRLQMVKQAAMRYIDRLPDEEEALVATFDDNLLLASPPTTDRYATVQAIQGIRPGSLTSLWDALFEWIRYLDSLPGQKILVVLTDGSDSSSRMGSAPRAILELAANRSDLSIFPLGLDLAGEAEPAQERNRALMRELADATGGLYHETHKISRLEEVFDRIRSRLRRRFYAVYIPPPDTSQELSRVRVRARSGLPCRVSSGGPPYRREETVAVSSPSDGISSIRADVRAGLLAGRVFDVVKEKGLLYDPNAFDLAGEPQTSFHPNVEVRQRDILIEAPDLQILTGTLRSPEAVLLRLLELHELEDDQCANEGKPSPFLIHGDTFLRNRQGIGLALFRNFPEYRERALARLAVEARPTIDRVLEEARKRPDADTSRLQMIEKTLLARVADPDVSAPQRFVAEWLGDVSAAKVANALELRLSNMFLGSGTERQLAVRVADSGWPILADWFRPATHVRVISPLIPAYSEDRDVIGFYRIVLPRPSLGTGRRERFPRSPTAFNLLRRFVPSDSLLASHRVGLSVESIERSQLASEDTRSLSRLLTTLGFDDYAPGVDRKVRQIKIRIAASDAKKASELDLTTYFQGDPEAPLLLSACRRGAVSASLETLAYRLAMARSYVQLPCETDPTGAMVRKLP